MYTMVELETVSQGELVNVSISHSRDILECFILVEINPLFLLVSRRIILNMSTLNLFSPVLIG